MSRIAVIDFETTGLSPVLMGDEVEPRREFIETNALRAANIDV